MFRIADVRQTQVVSPTVSAVLYTWTARTTAEGEHIPVRPTLRSDGPGRQQAGFAPARPIQPRARECVSSLLLLESATLRICSPLSPGCFVTKVRTSSVGAYIVKQAGRSSTLHAWLCSGPARSCTAEPHARLGSGLLPPQVRADPLELTPPAPLLLLLPVVMEHTVDERSPLFGHTSDSLTVAPGRPALARAARRPPCLPPAPPQQPSLLCCGASRSPPCGCASTSSLTRPLQRCRAGRELP